MMKRLVAVMATGLILTSGTSIGQTAPAGTPPASRSTSTGPKPYSEVITSKAQTNKGLFVTHRVDDKYYFEIPDSLLNREILVVNRISKAPAGARAGTFGYAGDPISDNVISFEKGPGNRIFLRTISYSERGRDSAGMYLSVKNSNVQPINAAFDVKAYAQDSVSKARGSVIDVTDYLMGDNDVLFFDSRVKRGLGLTNYQKDNSYVLDVKAFPTNIEIKTVKTFLRTPPAPAGQPTVPGQTGSPTTFELNSSMVLLPAVPMRPRYFDPRVGYFATSYTDFDANPQGVERISMVTRWRLEPKPGEEAKYLRGELVEPKKQIVYYIDPATPQKWIPYLMAGVNDWNVAFEKAGWKNAIVAKLAPKNDPTWSLEGAGHSAIVYKPSDIPNASGPHIHDPRTGEILESHINWYHNVMNLVRDWYFIQTSAVDPRARMLLFPDSLMGKLVQFVSAHEVGHTLGLRHNFGSSSSVPVESLRNRAWVEQYGHTPSIMDYARFNYVAQPEDNMSETGLMARIGDYDKWAIEWGYKWIPEAKTAEEEIPILNRLTIEKLKDKRYWFGTEVDPDDPRAQSEDLGDNSVLASTYGIKNLQRIIVKLPEWTKQPNKDYTSLNQMYNQVVTQFNRYMNHVAKNIGGIYTTPKTVEQPGMVIEFTPVERQKEAVKFLQDQLFKTPTWLANGDIASLTGTNALVTINNLQTNILNRVISTNTINKFARAEVLDKNSYTATQMLSDLKKAVWSELAGKQAIDIYRRGLQKAYVESLRRIISPEPATATLQFNPFGGTITPTMNVRTSDAVSLAKAHLRSLSSEIKSSLALYKDANSRAHLQDVVDRITDILDPK